VIRRYPSARARVRGGCAVRAERCPRPVSTSNARSVWLSRAAMRPDSAVRRSVRGTPAVQWRECCAVSAAAPPVEVSHGVASDRRPVAAVGTTGARHGDASVVPVPLQHGPARLPLPPHSRRASGWARRCRPSDTGVGFNRSGGGSPMTAKAPRHGDRYSPNRTMLRREPDIRSYHGHARARVDPADTEPQRLGRNSTGFGRASETIMVQNRSVATPAPGHRS
jgi:hypothetical protein